MKIGTILLNTCVNENHPYRYSVCVGQSNGRVEFICPSANVIKTGRYLLSDIGEDNIIQPIGYVDLANVLEKAIKEHRDR